MNNAPKAWYAHKGKKYSGNNPPFYDLNGVAWYDQLKHDLPEIKERLLLFLKLDGLNIQQYFNTTMVEGDGAKWETVSLLFWKLRNNKNINRSPDLFKHFSSIPGIVSLSVSILQPKTHIKGHYGDTDAIYRIHIPIYIPAQLPDCGLTVGGITRPWRDNEIIPFCDACFHEAWNMTDKPRIIMILDVVKKEFLPQTNKICANVLSSLKYQHFSLKYKFIRKFPAGIKDMIRNLLKLYPVGELK